ncbi:hypothetical protein ACFY2R_08355 [Micromonospora olivasterospora]|uniref:Uncharacterized protein n=1 Tax=Micromonospora olivasterospora TaxID=1880 RepID=A0A562I7S4_MICOL|nr:hypothetical protein [Micromonospora olivasterospora]TWH67061.1 hypothetical protein JD77_02025 [Micromonospora olivasterospora]
MEIRLPADTRLSLRAGEWATHGGQLGTTYLDLRVVDVGGEPTDVPGWVRVRGHGLECRWASVDCPEPWCIEITARSEALYDAANR